MKNSTPALPVLLLLLCVASAAGQRIDSLRRNAISLSLFPLVDRTLALSYAHRFANGRELTISSRARIAEANPASNVKTFLFFKSLNPDPRWYYNQYLLRVGMMFPLGGGFFYEPQIQLGYAFFNNKVIKVQDSPDEANDKSIMLDRRYFTGGLINNICWIKDQGPLRVKLFVGLGVHERKYYETKRADVYYLHSVPYDPPEKSNYWRGIFSMHLGAELGVRF